ncbi:hypothetical protein ACFVZT_11795 [Streptomyces sp. NPDC058321]|uniref:hypothetical protein n=1 Tax=Streptomyces sp. NPDC058321 TaxID=3346445 RepID=UPI0036E90BD7
MYTMRPATLSDHDAIERLTADRFQWMADRGYVPWPQSAAEFASKAGHAPMWCLLDGDRLCGVTIVVDRLGTAAWTDEERQEVSRLLTSTVTDPARAGQRLGVRIASWAVDYTAREGARWVRRVTTEHRLAVYYQEQGFSLVRECEFNGRPLYALQRPARRLPNPLGN